MRPIRPALHRILDFVTVAGFALAPTVFGFTGLPAMLSYALAVVHLALTLLTQFPPEARGAVPLRFHGIVELIVGPALVAIPFVLGWPAVARNFYIAMGAVIIVVRLLSEYDTEHA